MVTFWNSWCPPFAWCNIVVYVVEMLFSATCKILRTSRSSLSPEFVQWVPSWDIVISRQKKYTLKPSLKEFEDLMGDMSKALSKVLSSPETIGLTEEEEGCTHRMLRKQHQHEHWKRRIWRDLESGSVASAFWLSSLPNFLPQFPQLWNRDIY